MIQGRSASNTRRNKDAHTQIGSAEARVAAGMTTKLLYLELRGLCRKSSHLFRLLIGALSLCDKINVNTCPARQGVRRRLCSIHDLSRAATATPLAQLQR